MLYTFYTKIFINVNVGINENSISSDDEGINQALHDNNDTPNKNLNYKFLTTDEKLDYLCGKFIIYKIHPWCKKY